MENGHISGLFGKVKARITKTAGENSAIASIIFTEAHITLKETDFLIKKNVLVVQATHAKKNQLILKQEKILKKIHEATGLLFERIQ